MKGATALIIATTILLASCRKQEASNSIPHIPDSLALKVAILPISECDTLRGMVASGEADSMGLHIRLMEYNAMMDIDTAITNGRAHIYLADAGRISRMPAHIRPTLLMQQPVRYRIIANRTKRIRKAVSLKEHMVGSTRWSCLATWLDHVADSVGLKTTDVYHAQINDIALRASMVDDGLLDAGILPSPYADSLINAGHRVVATTQLTGMGWYMAPGLENDSIRKKQAGLFQKIISRRKTK
ncbi:MAG: hypothetical protein IJ606_03160 [Bacteroidaceae bacterium]|nr:hypothetical protein [Bacteroidaceae bacterium]